MRVLVWRHGGMQIIIVGAGKVGSTLAEHLAAENHSVSLIDLNLELLDQIQSQIDIRTLCGNGSHPSILVEAGADTAEMLIAVTNNDEANLVACQVAHSLFHTPIKIARVSDPDYLRYQSQLFDQKNPAVNFFINPQQQVTRAIQNLIETPGSLQVSYFFDQKIKLIVARPFYGSLLAGKKIGEIADILQIPIKVVGVYREGGYLTLDNELALEASDDVYLILESIHNASVMKSLRKISVPNYKNIFIVGGGQIGSQLAASLESRYHVKIIEKNRQRCEWLSDHLKHTLVLCGNCCDQNLLRNENIETTDVFCALTNDDEDNIIASLQAKRLGAKQAFALVNRMDYIDLITDKTININVGISPQQSTLSLLLGYIRGANIANIYIFQHRNSEALEIIIKNQHSKLIGQDLSQINLPPGVVMGALARSEKIFINENTIIQENDHLIFFVADKKTIGQLEDLVNQ